MACGAFSRVLSNSSSRPQRERGPNWEIPGAGNGFISGGPGGDEGRKLHFIPFRFRILTEKLQTNRERRAQIIWS